MLASHHSTATINNDNQDNTNLEISNWNSFKEKRTNPELYIENAVVMYVPTSVGVRGNAHIRRFFLNPQFADKNVTVQEVVCNVVMSNHRLIEESIWTVHFHSSECNWLVPQVEDRLLRNATIKFPMTVSTLFDEDTHKIASIRYFWDQACVLKQLKLIPDKVNWPAIGEQQIESLRSLDNVRLRDLNLENADSKLDKTGSNQTSHQQSNGIQSRNIFTYQPPPERRLVAPTNKLNSSFSFSHDDGSSNRLTTKLSQTSISQSHNMPAAGKATPRAVHNIIG